MAADYWTTETDNAGTDARRLWRSVNTQYTLLGEEKNTDGPSFTPEVFHDLIVRKVGDIGSSTASVPGPTFTRYELRRRLFLCL